MDKVQDNYSKPLDVKIEDENSSDNKLKSRSAKRKRLNSSSSTDGDEFLPENTFDMEKNLHVSAIKNNLDDASVKKILKKVVLNDHVLAYVKLREEKEETGTEEESETEEESGTESGEDNLPKLTRSKAKELMKVSPSSVPSNLPLTPIMHIPVNITPEVKALIAQELPEDEDDEEYEPVDDDHGLESCSDVDSQRQTPATSRSQKKPSPKVVQDGPFKVPQEVKTPVCRNLDLENEEAAIALRTRSKLSLSKTPIEHIEESFVPPDDLPVPDVDDLWNEFLNECLNPVPNVRNEDDDEADPEYNVAADPDANEEDEESIENSIIKISPKELSDLVSELFDVLPDGPVESLQDIQSVLDQDKGFELNPQHWEGKQEPISDEEHHATSTNNAAKMETRLSIGKTEVEENNELEQNIITNIIDVPMLVPIRRPVKKTICAEPQVPTRVIISVEEANEVRLPSTNGLSPPAPLKNLITHEPTTVEFEVDGNVKMYPEQILIYQQQLRQHIQLAASNFLQLYIHPTLWSYAPQYKEYLTSLYSMVVNDSIAIVDVCNLKPAIELLHCWENTLSENTKDTEDMVKFLKNEVEKCRRRSAANAVYTGEFHDTFKKVVANSPVFLYPHLLPPVPYRSEFHHKRFSYVPSEDKLIVLGLDQFWRHIKSNPSHFRIKAHARGRGWLTEAARLTRAYTLPTSLLSARALVSHVQVARRAKDGAIYRYFEYNEIEPVKHKLHPFNPKLTLYEQPELEMPPIWIKYLAKSSKRFKNYLYKNNKKRRCPNEPQGVEVELGKNININMEKTPLPIDFTKEILCNRLNVLPIAPKPTFVDKVDVPIQKTEQTATLLSNNIYTMIHTSSGTQLVPIQVQTSTVNSTITPICTPLSSDTKIDSRIDSNNLNDTTSNESNIYSIHCKCCRMFRRIMKKQTLITDYFNTNTKQKECCDCTNRKYPNISNKLKILINNFKRLSNVVYDELVNKIEECKTGFRCSKDTDGSSSKDFESAIKFQIKLVERCNIARNNLLKRSLNSIFNKFDVKNGDVFNLFKDLFHAFDIELADMYKELLGFLTADQAEKMDVFKDYFVRNCMEDLMEKVEEQVLNREDKCKIFEVLKEIYLDNLLKSCDICCKLMECTQEFPELVKYIYSLFPHRRREIKKEEKTCQPAPEIISNENKKDIIRLCDETTATMDYEADDTNSEEGEQEQEEFDEAQESDTPSSPRVNSSPNRVVITIKSENGDTSEVIITEDEDSDDSSNMSTLVMSADELKQETPEWQRDEDKLILEVLKLYLTPEEIKDKEKTILDIIEEKNVINIIVDSLTHKSMYDVRERILYLLRILIDGVNNK